jgi:hypothetical protein
MTNIRLLEVYSRSKGMLVHVWKTCRSNEGFQIIRCNCSSLFPEVPDGAHSAIRCGIDLGRVNHLTDGGKATNTAQVPQYLPAQSMYGYGYPISQSYNVPAIYPTYTPPTQMPIYFANTYGMPVNVRHGAILTEARGIFIRNLSYKCTYSDLHSLLLTAGQPVDYKLLSDSRTGVFKGLATATFGSQDLAVQAACCLNGVEHMGMTLSVRIDKETTPVGRTAPLIVDGSAYRVVPM